MLSFRCYIIVVVGSLILLSCQDNLSERQVVIKGTDTYSSATKNDTEIFSEGDEDTLRNQILSFKQGDSVEMLSIKINELYSLASYDELKALSDEAWSGKTNTPRNPQAAAVIASVLNDIRVEEWSILRTGIAFHAGLGFDQDMEKAKAKLLSPLLSDNAAANYFLSKIKLEEGAEDEAKTYIERAAQLGHRKAKFELGIK